MALDVQADITVGYNGRSPHAAGREASCRYRRGGAELVSADEIRGGRQAKPPRAVVLD
jgi:hypothetical protein